MSIFVHMKEGDCVWECPFPYILANTEWLMFCFFFLVPGVAEFAASFKSVSNIMKFFQLFASG